MGEYYLFVIFPKGPLYYSNRYYLSVWLTRERFSTDMCVVMRVISCAGGNKWYLANTARLCGTTLQTGGTVIARLGFVTRYSQQVVPC